jgi:hypothetical protein
MRSKSLIDNFFCGCAARSFSCAIIFACNCEVQQATSEYAKQSRRTTNEHVDLFFDGAAEVHSLHRLFHFLQPQLLLLNVAELAIHVSVQIAFHFLLFLLCFAPAPTPTNKTRNSNCERNARCKKFCNNTTWEQPGLEVVTWKPLAITLQIRWYPAN